MEKMEMSYLPRNAREYLTWMDNQRKLVQQRNHDIKEAHPEIDVNYNFASEKETPGFEAGYQKMLNDHVKFITGDEKTRAGYWRKDIADKFVDPDEKSKTLEKRHRELWYQDKLAKLCLSSDTIFTVFIGYDFECKDMFRQVLAECTSPVDYQKQQYEYIQELYASIGGFMVFPKFNGGINQSRNRLFKDRFDLTLKCIHLYYDNKEKTHKAKYPLEEVFQKPENQAYFDSFNNFAEYVDYFYLNAMVSDDYSQVRSWLWDGESKNKQWITKEDINCLLQEN